MCQMKYKDLKEIFPFFPLIDFRQILFTFQIYFYDTNNVFYQFLLSKIKKYKNICEKHYVVVQKVI